MQRLNRVVGSLKILATVVGLLASTISVYQALPAVMTLLGGPKPPLLQPQLHIQVSSNKYQYRIGENITLYYHITTDSIVETIIEKPDNTKSTLPAIQATSGTHTATIGIAWYPTGMRRVIAKASSTNATAQAISYYEVVEQPSEELLNSNSTATVSNSVYGPSFQILALRIERAEGTELTRFPGQVIQGIISYQLWSPANVSADQTWHMFLVYSWAQSWPPTTEFQEIYDGVPGRWPVPQQVTGLSFHSPDVPGTYYVWVVVTPTSTIGEALARLKEPLPLPAYLKINVVPKLKTGLTISVSSAEIPWGSSVTINGKLGPIPLNMSEVTIAYSNAQHEDFRILTHETPNSQGEFEFKWTPVLLQNYVIKAIWAGSDMYESATSELVYINVVIPWAHLGFGAVAVLAFASVIALWRLNPIGHVPPRRQKRHRKRSQRSGIRLSASGLF